MLQVDCWISHPIDLFPLPAHLQSRVAAGVGAAINVATTQVSLFATSNFFLQGCARRRARAHGSNTLSGDQAPVGFQSRLAPRDPNQMFAQCCEDRGLPDSCLSLCNFNAYTKEALMAMYFRTSECPISAAAEMQYCAAQGQDHRPCCVRQGVHTTLAGEKARKRPKEYQSLSTLAVPRFLRPTPRKRQSIGLLVRELLRPLREHEGLLLALGPAAEISGQLLAQTGSGKKNVANCIYDLRFLQ